MIDFFAIHLLIKEAHDEIPLPPKIIGHQPKAAQEIPVLTQKRADDFFEVKAKHRKVGKPAKHRWK